MREKSAAVLKSRSKGSSSSSNSSGSGSGNSSSGTSKCCPQFRAAEAELDGQKKTKETSGQIKIFFEATEGERRAEKDSTASAAAGVCFHLVATVANF